MLSQQQIYLLLVMRDAVLDGTLDLTSEQIAERLQKKANAPKLYEEKYITKLLSTVRQDFGSIEVISSYFYKGHKKYFLRGDLIVTRPETAILLIELRKAAANLGKVNRENFLELVRQNAGLANLPMDEILDRMAWAEQSSVNYIKSPSAEMIELTERVLNEIGYLFAITNE